MPDGASATSPFLRRHWATAMLVVACLLWGVGFSWSKNAGDAVNAAAGRASTAAVGHLTQLAIRFTLAAVLWAACVPSVFRGWTLTGLRNGVVIGLSLSVGLILQHVGLGLSDEAVIAFLTNLSVVFVPFGVLLTARRLPRRTVIAAVPVALVGMALMSGVGPGQWGNLSAGAVWGVACAAAFAAEILLLDRLAKGQPASHVTLLLFATAAVTCWLTAVWLPGFADIRWHTLVRHDFLSAMLPNVCLTTLGAFALMTIYQPKVDPTRAAVIYLTEPLFAAGFAWWLNGRTLSTQAMIGAALILAANVIAEWRPRRL